MSATQQVLLATASAISYPGFLGNRGMMGGGNGFSNVIDYWAMNGSPVNATDFGDLTVARDTPGAASSGTVAVWFGGNSGSPSNVQDKVTISTTGNATDCGDLTQAREDTTATGNTSRGLCIGGFNGGATYYNIIDYVTHGSLANAVDFGDLTSNRGAMGAASSDTRAVGCGGQDGTQGGKSEYVTIASTGNAVTHSALSRSYTYASATSDGTYLVFGAPVTPATDMDKLTIATTSTAADWGDLSFARGRTGSCCNGPRGMTAGGFNGGAQNIIDYYLPAGAAATATDWGDLTVGRYYPDGCSGN